MVVINFYPLSREEADELKIHRGFCWNSTLNTETTEQDDDELIGIVESWVSEYIIPEMKYVMKEVTFDDISFRDNPRYRYRDKYDNPTCEGDMASALQTLVKHNIEKDLPFSCLKVVIYAGSDDSKTLKRWRKGCTLVFPPFMVFSFCVEAEEEDYHLKDDEDSDSDESDDDDSDDDLYIHDVQTEYGYRRRQMLVYSDSVEQKIDSIFQ